MYNTLQEQIQNLLAEADRLHCRHESAHAIEAAYFEPGAMEYPAQSEGIYDAENGTILLRFEVKGTRYEGRTERIENVTVGMPVHLVRDRENAYNSKNFMIMTPKGKDLGNMPAALCNVIAPLYDGGNALFVKSTVSFVDPISKRSRHAKQAVLFVELQMQVKIV